MMILGGKVCEKLKNPPKIAEEIGYPWRHINSQRRLGPKPDFVGVPPRGSEIYFSGVPRHFNEDDIYPIFTEIGPIFEMRITMALFGYNRGYGFVRFLDVKSAEDAIFKLNGLRLPENRRLFVSGSVDNRCLHVSNLPRKFTKNDIVKVFEELVDGVLEFLMLPLVEGGRMKNNSGVLTFETHEKASKARRVLLPNPVTKLGRLTIDWAPPSLYNEALRFNGSKNSETIKYNNNVEDAINRNTLEMWKGERKQNDDGDIAEEIAKETKDNAKETKDNAKETEDNAKETGDVNKETQDDKTIVNSKDTNSTKRNEEIEKTTGLTTDIIEANNSFNSEEDANDVLDIIENYDKFDTNKFKNRRKRYRRRRNFDSLEPYGIFDMSHIISTRNFYTNCRNPSEVTTNYSPQNYLTNMYNQWCTNYSRLEKEFEKLDCSLEDEKECSKNNVVGSSDNQSVRANRINDPSHAIQADSAVTNSQQKSAVKSNRSNLPGNVGNDNISAECRHCPKYYQDVGKYYSQPRDFVPIPINYIPPNSVRFQAPIPQIYDPRAYNHEPIVTIPNSYGISDDANFIPQVPYTQSTSNYIDNIQFNVNGASNRFVEPGCQFNVENNSGNEPVNSYNNLQNVYGNSSPGNVMLNLSATNYGQSQIVSENFGQIPMANDHVSSDYNMQYLYQPMSNDSVSGFNQDLQRYNVLDPYKYSFTEVTQCYPQPLFAIIEEKEGKEYTKTIPVHQNENNLVESSISGINISNYALGGMCETDITAQMTTVQPICNNFFVTTSESVKNDGQIQSNKGFVQPIINNVSNSEGLQNHGQICFDTKSAETVQMQTQLMYVQPVNNSVSTSESLHFQMPTPIKQSVPLQTSSTIIDKVMGRFRTSTPIMPAQPTDKNFTESVSDDVSYLANKEYRNVEQNSMGNTSNATASNNGQNLVNKVYSNVEKNPMGNNLTSFTSENLESNHGQNLFIKGSEVIGQIEESNTRIGKMSEEIMPTYTVLNDSKIAETGMTNNDNNSFKTVVANTTAERSIEKNCSHTNNIQNVSKTHFSDDCMTSNVSSVSLENQNARCAISGEENSVRPMQSNCQPSPDLNLYNYELELRYLCQSYNWPPPSYEMTSKPDGNNTIYSCDLVLYVYAPLQPARYAFNTSQCTTLALARNDAAKKAMIYIDWLHNIAYQPLPPPSPYFNR